MPEIISLDGTDWQCKPYVGMDWLWRHAHEPASRDVRHWLPATVPGSVQHDLWRAGKLPDPYFEMNTLLAEWAPQRTWVYKKTFVVGPEHQGRRIRLRFEGVDYTAEFFLNGERLGDHHGMFSPAVFDVAGRLNFGQENLLAVVIEPAPAEQPQVGLSRLVRTHKPRMNYWWDFCPRMVHQGIWDGVWLEITGALRVESAWVRPRLSDDMSVAAIAVQIVLSSGRPATAAISLTIRDEAGRAVGDYHGEQRLEGDGSPVQVEAAVDVAAPRLWWPNGYGDQPLYRAEIEVAEAETGQVSDGRQVSFGIRRLELAANATADPAAQPYTLVVNGHKIYLRGWNWVPMDVLYGVERPEKLRRLLELVRRAHVNLLRVWGGGLVEKEAFYDLCDRLGILVWQEFVQSSSGIENTPPDDPGFIAELAAEAAVIVARKRNHPSLGVWCGGNELATPQGRPLDERHPDLAALRGVVAAHDPDRLWLPTSPSGPEFFNSPEAIDTNPAGMHDVHGPWEHQGLEGQFALYNRGSSLLHSEFGAEGITNQRTLDAVIAPEHQWPIDLDNPYWYHLGAWWLKEPAWRAAFGELPDVETAVRATQFLQFDALRYAVEADRRRKWQNSGSLPWQFNEPYPMAACTSAVDYYARPKPAYYAVAAAYAPIHVSARFERQAWAGYPRFEAQVWVSNSHDRDLPGVLSARIVSAKGNVVTSREQAVTCRANAATPLLDIGAGLDSLDGDVFLLDLRLSDERGGILSENWYVFSRAANLAPLLALPRTVLDAAVDKHEAGARWDVRLTNTGPAVAFSAWAEDDRPLAAVGYAYIDPNYVTLLPGESHTLTVDWDGVPAPDRALVICAWNSEGIRCE